MCGWNWLWQPQSPAARARFWIGANIISKANSRAAQARFQTLLLFQLILLFLSPSNFRPMYALARIRDLARQIAYQNAQPKHAPDKFDLAAVCTQNLCHVPSALWEQFTPRSQSRARFGAGCGLHAISKRARKPSLRAAMDTVLGRARWSHRLASGRRGDDKIDSVVLQEL